MPITFFAKQPFTSASVALVAIAALTGSGLVPHGSTTQSTADTVFTPQSGFAFSGSSTSGGVMTITSTGNVFGSKPYSGQPLVWAPMDTTMDGSSLGRISGSGTWNTISNLVWQAGCGPSGAGGCAYGGTTKGDGNTGGPGQVYNASAAVDLDEWSGWASQNSGTGYYINDLGQQLYVYRQEYHSGFGHLDLEAARSYNGIGNYNDKNIRFWSRYQGTDNSPDIYWPVSDQRLSMERCASNCAAIGITTGAPVPYINATTVGSPDYTADYTIQQNFDGMTSGSAAYNNWATSEFYYQANSNPSAAASYSGGGAPNSQFWYWVVGQNGNQSIESWPISNWQNSSPGVAWMFVDSGSLQSNGHGTLIRAFAMHYIVDGTSDCPVCSDMPLNGYVNYGPVYLDDCWCHIVVQDSATYNSATAREIQIPSSWSSGSITMTLRAGAFGTLSGKYLFVIDPAGTAHYIGSFM